MRKTWMIVTVALAAVILTAGVLLLPVVYAGIFDAGKIIYEEEAWPEELIMAPELFMDRFRYPLQEETESMPKVYERAFALVGLEEEERYWDALSAVKGRSLFLLQTQAEKGGKEYRLDAAMSDALIPFLICCKSGKEPSEAEVGEAAEALGVLCDSETESLRRYVEEIDGVYETCQEYQNRVRELYLSLLREGESMEPGQVQEIRGEIPLWDCCVRGEWQVCADNREAVLVCMMGQGALVLYYDAVEGEFCGYRIQFSDAW